MGGSDTTQTTQSQSVQQLPPWINQAAQQNYGFAQNVAEQPLQQYQGQMVADVSPQTQQSWNTAATGGSAGQDQYNAAQAGLLGVLGSAGNPAAQGALAAPVTAAQSALAAPTTAAQGQLAPNTVAAQTAAAQSGLSQLSGTNLQPYMNPYTQSVINNTLPIMQQANALNQNQIQNQANSANAFGGSRQGIQQGVAQAQGAQNIGQMAAQLNQANFQQAQQAGEFDVNAANNMGQFNAGQANTVGMANTAQANTVGMNNQSLADQMAQYNAGQSNQVGMYNQGQANQMGQFNAGQTNSTNLADMTAANAMNQFNAGAQNTMTAQGQNAALQAASGLGALGNQAQLSQARNFTEQMTAGQMQQQQAQNQINAQMAKFQNASNYPNQQLSVLQSALGMTPYEQGQQGSSTTQTQTAANPAQMALGGLSTLGSLFSGGAGGFAGSPIGGLMTAMGGGSDRRLKTDITKVGSKMGVPIHAYRYKGDPKSYPKVVGPMAEDVAKTFGPGSVAKIPGSGGKMAVHPAIMGALAAPRGPAMGPPIAANAMGGPRMPGPNLAAIAGGGLGPSGRPPMGAMAPPVPVGAMGGPRMPGPNLGAIAAGGQGPLAAPKMIRPRRMRMPMGALAGG